MADAGNKRKAGTQDLTHPQLRAEQPRRALNMAQPKTDSYDSHLRSVVKGLAWRCLATLATISLVYAFTHKLALSFEVGAVEVVLKLILYYGHERAWNYVTWGRLPRNPDTTTRESHG